MELRRKRRLEHVKVVPFSRRCTGLQALFRDDQVEIQPTMITLPSLSCLSPFFFPFPLSLASNALSKLSLFFLITSDLRHFGPTSASFRLEDRVSTQPLYSQNGVTNVVRLLNLHVRRNVRKCTRL